MPFLPLFIVIGIFLATSKVLQPNPRKFQSASQDYDDRLLNQALIDYIAREARGQSTSDFGDKTHSKKSKQRKSGQRRR